MNASRRSSFGLVSTTSRSLTANSTVAGLVACPVLAMVWSGMNPSAIHEVYRVAYERAVAASRPSRFEVAMKVWLN